MNMHSTIAAYAPVGATDAVISTEFQAAITAHRKAVATADEWQDRVYGPALKACQIAEEAIPHFTTKASCAVASDEPTKLSTANPAHLALARIYKSLTADGHRLGGGDSRAIEELLAKLKWRDAEKLRIHEAHNMDAIEAEMDRLEALSFSAQQAVEDFPVTTIADLIAKVEFAEELESQVTPGQLMADLRRLARRRAV